MRRANARGFTLLELVLVIMLLGILLAGAFSGISTTVRAMRSGEAAIERVDKIRTVQEFLRHQLSRTLPFPYTQTQTANEIFQGDAEFMRFVAPMPGYLSRGGAYVQTLELRSGGDGMQLVFTSTLLNGFDGEKGIVDESSTVVLLDGIQDGKFSYRGINAQKQLMNWSDNWPDPTITPLLVNIDLHMAVRGQIDWPMMTIPLMMDASAQSSTSGVGLQR